MESANSLDTILVLVFATAGLMLLITGVVMFIYLYQRKQIKRKKVFQEVEDLLKRQELKTVYALLKGQDKERSRIAQELHDNISNSLVTLKMYLDSAERKILPKEQSELFTKISGIAQQAEENTRKLSYSLDFGSLRHFGLSMAITDLMKTINKTDGCQFEFSNHLKNTVTGELAMNIYRIVQEMVKNTLKHAQASLIKLEITEIKNEYLNIIFEDNGIGFDPEKICRGLGLKNIQSRLEKLNGTITFDVKNAGQTTIILDIPLS